ncbi:MAG: cell division protein ZapA [Clostridia bacterium]|nr:cell division protein ZapA [Clostridia bacterium]
MDKKSKVNVRIFGNDYTLVGVESEEYINKVCFTVDKKMREIAQNPVLKPLKISVLTAINMCDEYYKAKYMFDRVNTELKECRNEITELRAEIKALEEEKKFLKEEINSYRRNDMK